MYQVKLVQNCIEMLQSGLPDAGIYYRNFRVPHLNTVSYISHVSIHKMYTVLEVLQSTADNSVLARWVKKKQKKTNMSKLALHTYVFNVRRQNTMNCVIP